MAADPGGAGDHISPDKLSILVFSGDYHRVHYALAMASAAAAVNRPATLFFTMEAIRALGKPCSDGTPGWHGLAITDGAGTAAAVDRQFASRGVATFDELLSACITFEVTFMVCEMGLRAVDMTAANLRGDITYTEGGIVSFLADASKDGAVIFV